MEHSVASVVSNGLAYTPLASDLVYRVQDFAHLFPIPVPAFTGQLTSAALPRRYQAAATISISDGQHVDVEHMVAASAPACFARICWNRLAQVSLRQLGQ